MDALEIPRLRGVIARLHVLGRAGRRGDAHRSQPGGAPRVAASIYGAGLCALFGGSGLYHRWRWHPRWRPILRRVDHSTIFVFIAACYTPVGMLVLSGTTRWVVMITVWAGALGGVALSVAWITAPRALCAACYVALGWVAVLAVPADVGRRCRPRRCVLIASGGVLYTAGAVIFALGRPNPWPRTFGFHEIFHVFVILAAVVHFVAMAGWVVPPA